MKKTLLLFIVVCISGIYAHAQTNSTKIYQDTASVSASKAELFTRANEYFAKSNANLENVIQFQDLETGKIISKTVSKKIFDIGGQGLMKLLNVVRFTTTVSIKDNKYKYTISDVYYDTAKVTPKTADEMILSAVDQLKKTMSTKSSTDL